MIQKLYIKKILAETETYVLSNAKFKDFTSF